MRRRFQSCSGTSLAETLIAVAILAAGLLSLAQLFIVSSTVLRRSSELSTAAILAGQKLEELRAAAMGDDEATADGVEFLDPAGSVLPARGADAGQAAAYTRRWSIRPLPADAALRIVEVRVTPGRQGRAGGADPAGQGAGDVSIVAAYARDEP